jgi:putative transposase
VCPDSAEVRGGVNRRVPQGKSAIAIAREFTDKDRNFTGERFWARGYAVSTVGVNLEQVKA